MRPRWRILPTAAACLCLLVANPASADNATDVRRLVAQADGMLRLGMLEGDRAREFAGALEILAKADDLLAAVEISQADRVGLARQINALREELTTHLERSRRRFYGAFPLARLALPFPLLVPQDDLTESTHLRSANEAVRRASEHVVAEIIRFQYPHVIFRSVPRNPEFENEAMRVFSNADRPFSHSRSEVVRTLTPDELGAFDRGDLTDGTVARMMEDFGTTKLLVLTIRADVDLPDATMVVLEGTFFEAGTLGPSDSFSHVGFARARGSVLRHVLWAHLVLLAASLVLATTTPWSRLAPWPMIQRIAVGTGLFAAGRLFSSLAVILLGQLMPNLEAPAGTSWWWPSLVGLVMVLGAGLVAWLFQARWAGRGEGRRSGRDVGVTFAIASLGASAYFAGPLLLLDPERAPLALMPWVTASVILAALAGYAVRTGPPVPHYFVLGPVVLAPLAGIALFSMSFGRLWALVGASVVLSVVAAARHKYAVTRGIEEAEPEEDAAEQADRERLEQIARLRKDLGL